MIKEQVEWVKKKHNIKSIDITEDTLTSRLFSILRQIPNSLFGKDSYIYKPRIK